MPDTTTIEVTYEVWEALDKRKERGESFDDVIRRLVDATGLGVGEIREDAAIEVHSVEPVEDPPAGATCSHYDTVAMEACGDPATHLQTMSYDDGDEMELYLCEDHAKAHEPSEM